MKNEYTIKSNHQFLMNFNKFHITLLDSGYAKVNSEWTTCDYKFPCTSPFSRLYYIESGDAYIHFNKKRIQLVPGYMYLIPIYLPIHLECPVTMTQLYFHITSPRNDDLDLFEKCDDIYFAKTSFNHIKKLKTAYLCGTYADIFTLQNIISSDIQTLIKGSAVLEQKPADYSSIVKSAIHFINKNLYITLTVPEVAHALNISNYTLSSLFKKEMKKTIGQYIDERVMQRALELMLYNSEMSINDISSELGFCDQFYFSKKFKIFAGEKPLSFRLKRNIKNSGK